MKLGFIVLSWLTLAVGLTACGASGAKLHGTVLEPPLTTVDLPLIDQDGQAARIGDFKGNPVLVFFGYTHCPDVCPVTLGRFKQIRNMLGADGARVRFVFVTVDPERDTPARMKEYLANFDPGFVGLTAGTDTLAQVYRAYGIHVEEIMPDSSASNDASHSVAHTSSIFLLDDKAQVRLIYGDTPWQDVAADLRFFLSNLAKVSFDSTSLRSGQPSQG
ncbi:MAG: SCO family protein [Chloroflexi bacterium]|nr:SCO family protein [Chloroflexota bacterium]